MKISLAFSVISLVLCQRAHSAEPTCESIDCVGPYKLCTHQNGKPECLLLGIGPVQTCATVNCPAGTVCVNNGECVNSSESRERARKPGRVCGKQHCKPDHVCVKGKCERIFIHPVRTEPPTERAGKQGPICGKEHCKPGHVCIKGKCEVIFIDPIRTESPVKRAKRHALW